MDKVGLNTPTLILMFKLDLLIYLLLLSGLPMLMSSYFPQRLHPSYNRLIDIPIDTDIYVLHY